MLNYDLLSSLLLSGVINLVIWLAALLYVVGVRRTPIYHPVNIYLAYHFLGFIVRPFAISVAGESFLWDRIGFTPSANEIWRVTFVTNLALVSLLIGFVIAGAKKKVLPMLDPVELQVERPRLFWLAVALLSVAGYYATYRSLAGAGLDSVLAYSTSLDAAGGQRLQGVSGYMTALAEFLPVICIYLLFFPRARKFAIVFIAVFIAVRVYAGAQRLSFVVVLAAIFMLYHISRRLRYPKLLPVLGVLVFALIFDVIGGDRYALRRIVSGEGNVSEVISSYVTRRGGNALTSDIVEYDVATAVVTVVSRHADYSYGTQFLRLLIWPIPRQLWPEKPVYTSIVDLNKYGDFRYLTTSLYGDTYMVFSYPAVAIMMFLLGILIAKIYENARVTNSVMAYMFFWVFIIYIKTILRDGGVSVVYFWIFSMIAVAVLTKMGKVKLCRKTV